MAGDGHGYTCLVEGVRALVRRFGYVDHPAGLRWGDHLCWIYDFPDSWRSAATRFLLEGVARGERLLYLAAEAGPDALSRDLSGLPGRDELVASGRLLARLIHEPAGRWDADARLDAFRTIIGDARRDGYPGLRLAADATPLLARVPDPARFITFELAFDRTIATAPAVAMCGFHRGAVGRAAEDMLSFAHPLCHRSGLETGVHLYADGRGGWRLVGGVDASSAGHLAAALAAMSGTGDVHLHLEGLRFCAAAATRALVEAAADLHPTARLVLHDPPPLLRRVLEIGWPGDNPGLAIAGPDRLTTDG